jgi:hypothetical protein
MRIAQRLYKRVDVLWRMLTISVTLDHSVITILDCKTETTSKRSTHTQIDRKRKNLSACVSSDLRRPVTTPIIYDNDMKTKFPNPSNYTTD